MRPDVPFRRRRAHLNHLCLRYHGIVCFSPHRSHRCDQPCLCSFSRALSHVTTICLNEHTHMHTHTQNATAPVLHSHISAAGNTAMTPQAAFDISPEPRPNVNSGQIDPEMMSFDHKRHLLIVSGAFSVVLHICTSMYTYGPMYVYVYASTCIYIRMNIFIYTYTRARFNVFLQAYTPTYTHTCTRTCTHMHTHTYINTHTQGTLGVYKVNGLPECYDQPVLTTDMKNVKDEIEALHSALATLRTQNSVI